MTKVAQNFMINIRVVSNQSENEEGDNDENDFLRQNGDFSRK